MKLRNILRKRGESSGKSLPASETVRRGLSALMRLSPPVRVALKRIDNSDVLDIPVYKCEAFGESLRCYPQGEFFKHTTYGKGQNAAFCKASALMEFVERFSCQSFLNNRRNYRLLFPGSGEHARAAAMIPFSWHEFYRKDKFILRESGKVPLRSYNAFSLTDNGPFALALEWFTPTTNGFASGNCLEEAVLQGLCEVIERHNISEIVEKEVRTPLLDIKSIKNGLARRIIARFAGAGVELFIRDFTHKIGIPTVGVFSYDRKAVGAARFHATAGTSVGRDIALMRALTELAQNRSQGLSQRKCLYRSCGFSFYCNLSEARYLAARTKQLPFSSLPDYADGNFKKEIGAVVRQLALNGLRAFAAETTHPVLKIPSVIVSVPGAKHKQCGFTNPYFKLHKEYLSAGKDGKAADILERFLRVYGARGIKKEYLFGLAEQYERGGRSRLAERIYESALGAFALEKDRVYVLKCYRGLARVLGQRR